MECLGSCVFHHDTALRTCAPHLTCGVEAENDRLNHLREKNIAKRHKARGRPVMDPWDRGSEDWNHLKGDQKTTKTWKAGLEMCFGAVRLSGRLQLSFAHMTYRCSLLLCYQQLRTSHMLY